MRLVTDALMAIFMAVSPCSPADIYSYKPGFLDQYNYVQLDHFAKTPEEVLTSHKKWAKNPTEGNFNELRRSVFANPRSMSSVKLLFDTSLKCGETDDILRHYYKKTLEDNSEYWPYYRLSLSYLQRISVCNRVKSEYARENESTLELSKYFKKSDAEARFIVYESMMSLGFGKARETLENLVIDRPNDYWLHVELGINYCYNAPEERYSNYGGKTNVVIKAAPLRYDLALVHAKKAISIKPQCSVAYYLAYAAEKNKDQKLKYLRKYVEFAKDKTCSTYKLAKAKLER